MTRPAGGPAVRVGDAAPDFTLPDGDRRQVTLSGFRGARSVLVVFFPFAFSGICTAELSAVQEHIGEFADERVQVLGVSTDPTYALRAWAAAQGFDFPLLSDFWPHGAVARSYGVFHEPAGMAVRGTFLIDLSGTVAFTELNDPGQPRDAGNWARAIQAMTGQRPGSPR